MATQTVELPKGARSGTPFRTAQGACEWLTAARDDELLGPFIPGPDAFEYGPIAVTEYPIDVVECNELAELVLLCKELNTDPSFDPRDDVDWNTAAGVVMPDRVGVIVLPDPLPFGLDLAYEQARIVSGWVQMSRAELWKAKNRGKHAYQLGLLEQAERDCWDAFTSTVNRWLRDVVRQLDEVGVTVKDATTTPAGTLRPGY